MPTELYQLLELSKENTQSVLDNTQSMLMKSKAVSSSAVTDMELKAGETKSFNTNHYASVTGN